MPVDQCVSEPVICLAAVLLRVGRWERYPYPRHLDGLAWTRSGVGLVQSKISGITVRYTIPTALLF